MNTMLRMPLLRAWPILLASALLFAIVAPATAQSPFSMTNIGGDVRSSDARIDGRGGWGLVERDTLVPSFHNLAGLIGLRKIAVVISGYGERTSSEDASGSRTTSRVLTPTLRAAAPFMKGRLVLSAGFHALRGTQYNTSSERVYLLPNPDDPLGPNIAFPGTEYFTREGTQFQVPLGLSWRVNDALSVGASLNIMAGIIRERVNILFDEPTTPAGLNYFLTTSETLEEEIGGLSSTWSVLVDPVPGLAIGATYTTPHDWDMTSTHDMQGIPGNVVQEYTVSMPGVWGLGAAVNLSERWRFGAEFEHQPFSELTGRADWEAVMVDAWRFGVGFDRSEAFARRAGHGNRPLRLGFSMQRWPYMVDGDEVIERRVSAGTGFSFREQSGHLDLALSYAWIGELGTNGSRDRVWRFTVSVAGLENWW